MWRRNNSNQSTIRITKTIKEEAEDFVGKNPKPYTSLSKLNDEALREKITVLDKKYPNFKKTSGDSKRNDLLQQSTIL